MRALPVTVGLVSLLQAPNGANAFPETVRLIGFSVSHKIFRVAGRPPPHYGGALKLGRAQEL